MTELRKSLIRLAGEKPELRKYLIPLLRKEAMEFDSKEEMEEYRRTHKVKPDTKLKVVNKEEEEAAAETEKKSPIHDRKKLKDTASDITLQTEEFYNVIEDSVGGRKKWEGLSDEEKKEHLDKPLDSESYAAGTATMEKLFKVLEQAIGHYNGNNADGAEKKKQLTFLQDATIFKPKTYRDLYKVQSTGEKARDLVRDSLDD